MPQTTKTIELHGHRGARGLVAENTLASFREAIRLGVDYIETDIGMSRDGEIVLHHDRALSGTISRRDGIWIAAPVLIKDLTMEQLQAYDVGRLQPGTPYA
ncbi:MAG TPA: glycerophosphodiester phosphodiesterase family protein, partial [Hyphomicrobiaceae bacterium]|nr:glycerophosphodiester phosphodiesterase family protein [Hyphomicrobiaceae bacterium]